MRRIASGQARAGSLSPEAARTPGVGWVPVSVAGPPRGAQPVLGRRRRPLELGQAAGARRLRPVHARAIEREAIAVIARLGFEVAQVRPLGRTRWHADKSTPAGRRTRGGSRCWPERAHRRGTSHRPARADPRPRRGAARAPRPAAGVTQGETRPPGHGGRAACAVASPARSPSQAPVARRRGRPPARPSAARADGLAGIPASTSTTRLRTSVSIQSRSSDAGMRSSRSSRSRSWSSR